MKIGSQLLGDNGKINTNIAIGDLFYIGDMCKELGYCIEFDRREVMIPVSGLEQYVLNKILPKGMSAPKECCAGIKLIDMNIVEDY